MSDCRLGAPEGRLEQAGGDGAAAFVMGSGDDVIAEIVASASIHARISRYLADAGGTLRPFMGGAFCTHPGVRAAARQGHRVGAGKGWCGACGARAGDSRFAQPARGRGDRARDEARPGENVRHARAHCRADRRRACGSAADGRLAVAQVRRPGIDRRRGRRRRRDRVAGDAGGGEVSADAIRSAA